MERRSFLSAAAISFMGLGALAKHTMADVHTNTNDDGWVTIPGTNGGLKIKTLFKEGTAAGLLYNMAPGFPVGPHRHPAGEYSYLVEGSFFIGEEELFKGEYRYMKPGTKHPASKAGTQGAIVFVFTPEPVQPIK